MLSGVPAGVILRAEDFASDLERRRPQSKGETPRHEADEPIIEGVDAEGVTTGNSVTIKFRNTNCKSGDYSHLRLHPRPSHADLTQRMKYGEEYNLAGGGMASGRMTVALVAAGVVAKQIVPEIPSEYRVLAVISIGYADYTPKPLPEYEGPERILFAE